MAISRVSGNQIATSTQAIITTLSFLNTNSVLRLPSGTTAQRPTGVSIGTLRFNSTIDQAEIYKADDGTGSAGWAPVAGGGLLLELIVLLELIIIEYKKILQSTNC